ncbi:GFA family protein [Litoreibacter sp.]|nr:GFA family protein [Litoreibacter sp.]
MAQTSKGGCLCDASNFTFSGEAKFTIQCYCRDCQHVSGGGHLPQLGVSSDGFLSSGPIKNYTQKSDAGNDLTFSFCGQCGAPLFKTTSKAPELTFVYAGALTDPTDLNFDTHVFESSKQSWDKT